MYDFMNNTSLIGSALNEFTFYVSGDAFLTLFCIIGFIIFFGLVFRVPIEWLSIVLVPISIYFVAVEPRFGVVGGLIFIFVAFIIIRNFWFTIK
jgi:hypothetical protein